MLEIKKLQNQIFGPVTFTLQSGQSIVVKGASGTGKTRFLRAVSDLDDAEGSIILNGQSHKDIPASNWRKKVRFVPADSAWWFENVIEHFPTEFDLAENMKQLNLKSDLINWQVSKLSTGEKQRLAFLRAIADEPEVLLLDEPTSALDVKSAEQVEQLIEDLLARGVIILLASHNAEQAKRFGPNEIIFSPEGIRVNIS